MPSKGKIKARATKMFLKIHKTSYALQSGVF
jgi:hypothetical protein